MSTCVLLRGQKQAGLAFLTQTACVRSLSECTMSNRAASSNRAWARAHSAVTARATPTLEDVVSGRPFELSPRAPIPRAAVSAGRIRPMSARSFNAHAEAHPPVVATLSPRSTSRPASPRLYPSKKVSSTLRKRLAAAAHARYQAAAEAGLLMTLVDDPVVLMNGRPLSARQLSAKCDEDVSWARARAQREALARAAEEKVAARQAELLSAQRQRKQEEATARRAARQVATEKAAARRLTHEEAARARELAIVEAAETCAAARRCVTRRSKIRCLRVRSLRC